MPLCTYDQISDSIAISFDKQQTKLEHREFSVWPLLKVKMQLTIGLEFFIFAPLLKFKQSLPLLDTTSLRHVTVVSNHPFKSLC